MSRTTMRHWLPLIDLFVIARNCRAEFIRPIVSLAGSIGRMNSALQVSQMQKYANGLFHGAHGAPILLVKIYSEKINADI